MARYYCPYCNPKYQFNREDKEGKLICGLCGEYLVKKSNIQIKQIVAFLVASSFILPILYLFFVVIMNQNNQELKNQKITFLSYEILKSSSTKRFI